MSYYDTLWHGVKEGEAWISREVGIEANAFGDNVIRNSKGMEVHMT